MTRSTEPGGTKMRRDHQPGARTDDSYRQPKRVAGGTSCSQCGATCENGRWTWHAAADDARQIVCPACRRILEGVPAGELVLSGDYLQAHVDDVLGLLHNQAAGEEKEHPLERIMAIDSGDGQVVVRTTGPHLVRRLGEAMLRAHQGQLTMSYGENEALLRGTWSRGSTGK
ncbi:BCAM0308 family protein [Paraburkholderia kururiensis]|uniref:BCAM0308 family protein n=1 Tax=Paraburkholderia kururiensis TaxID=984307 RepID=A0ABZ0WQJ4_9BURK|nr:BCAM0308 family protein [Paraburkholderia kururiensis]WQD79679.1 BCAM0308 family protein [Paraburkholderia kururiensis]